MTNAEFVASLKQLCRQAGYFIDSTQDAIQTSNNFRDRHIITLTFSAAILDKDELVGGNKMLVLTPDEFFLTGEL